MPQRVQRHFACDRDGGCMELLAGARADECGANDRSAVLIDNYLCIAVDALATHCRTGGCAKSVFDDLDVNSFGARLLFGEADLMRKLLVPITLMWQET